MIDLHNHILPGVDDGARSVEEACDMARALVAQGVTQVCCTPHTTDWAKAGDEASIRQRVADLQSALDHAGIGLKLLPGAEAHITPTLVGDVKRHAVATLNGGPYLLLEFPYDSLPPFYEQVVFDLQVNGIRPVIAHPERIAPIAEDARILYELVRRGCLAQLTAMSLAGGFGPRIREVSELMLEHRLIHVIASDAHDADAGGRLFALAGTGRQDLLETTPEAIVRGLPVEAPEPMEPKRRHFFGRIFG